MDGAFLLRDTQEKTLEVRAQDIRFFLDACTYDYTAIRLDHCVYRTPQQVLIDRACVCLDGALFAAEFMIPEHHYTPKKHGLLFFNYTLDSGDSRSHVVYVFRDSSGNFGAIGKSRHSLLTHRNVKYCSIDNLTQSYIDVFEGEFHRHSIATAYVDLLDVGLCRKKQWEWRQRLQEFLMEITYTPRY